MSRGSSKITKFTRVEVERGEKKRGGEKGREGGMKEGKGGFFQFPGGNGG